MIILLIPIHILPVAKEAVLLPCPFLGPLSLKEDYQLGNIATS